MRSNLRSACRILSSRPLWHWYLPWNYPTYRYLRYHVIPESVAFLQAVGQLRSGERDAWGDTYWLDGRGRLVRWELGG